MAWEGTIAKLDELIDRIAREIADEKGLTHEEARKVATRLLITASRKLKESD